MNGYVTRPDPNRYVADKWLGQTVNWNGSEEFGKVVRATWTGFNEPVNLIVDWENDRRDIPYHTDSEHVTIVRQH